MVKYIMVGGYATNLNGYQRYTGDMDMDKDTIENLANLRIAFRTVKWVITLCWRPCKLFPVGLISISIMALD
jgi:hypothetical protein